MAGRGLDGGGAVPFSVRGLPPARTLRGVTHRTPHPLRSRRCTAEPARQTNVVVDLSRPSPGSQPFKWHLLDYQAVLDNRSLRGRSLNHLWGADTGRVLGIPYRRTRNTPSPRLLKGSRRCLLVTCFLSVGARGVAFASLSPVQTVTGS